MKFSVDGLAARVVAIALAVLAGQPGLARDYVPDHGDFRFSGDTVVLPLVEQSTHPIVHVDIGDGAQRAFIVDTGAGVNVIDSSIAASSGYEATGETEIGAPGGPQIAARIVKVPVLHLDGATIIDAEFVTMDLLEFSGGQVQGVLGVGLFREHLVTFDLRGRKIVVSNGRLRANQAGIVPYDPSERQIAIEIEVAGTSVPTHIDTGSMGGFTLPADLSDSLPLSTAPQPGPAARLVGGERNLRIAQLDGAIRFAGFSHENPTVAFMDPSPGSANIGGQVLAGYLVTIDQRNNRLQFRAQREGPGSADSNRPRRLGIRFRGVPGGKVLTVAGVDPGSLGEAAGVLPGDVLVAINGRPTEEYSMSDLGTLFGSSTHLLFGMERAGKPHVIEIP
ncbi:MAG: aspartyl protease family protein [Gammaproteobacteria bacterium]|nr:aspartyl protease family protein [Gammaproteobacteria bacterium]